MDKTERERLIAEAASTTKELRDKLRSIVFPDDINDVEEFEKLPRQERYGLAGILQGASDLLNNIKTYQSWFCDKK